MLDDDDEEEGGGSSRKRVRSSFIDDEAVVDSDDEEEEEDDAEDEMHILSAVALDNVKNYIFIEVGKEAHVREVADVDNVQRGVRVTLIPQIDSQAIANKLDGGEEVKKVAFVPPCFVNGDEASTSFGAIIRVESEAFQILSGVPKRPEVSLVRLREIKCKIEKKSNVLDGYKNTVSVNDVFRIGDGPCKGNSYMRYGKTPRRIPPLPRRLSRGGPHLESGGRNRGGRGGHDSLVVDRHDVVVPAPRWWDNEGPYFMPDTLVRVHRAKNESIVGVIREDGGLRVVLGTNGTGKTIMASANEFEMVF
ncbi:hypothetical protein GH714_043887 [Hevea brasiliensis]|uniref:Uncharacterized protein n=1 Tax=Hevea brasiliensis TaxID=3981 RepID=A0A6A6K2F0_HEVBR|nr:hypothetical protein GH714_043887 [Hevea brasiliensis]